MKVNQSKNDKNEQMKLAAIEKIKILTKSFENIQAAYNYQTSDFFYENICDELASKSIENMFLNYLNEKYEYTIIDFAARHIATQSEMSKIRQYYVNYTESENFRLKKSIVELEEELRMNAYYFSYFNYEQDLLESIRTEQYNKNVWLQELYDRNQEDQRLYLNRYSEYDSKIKNLNDELMLKNKDMSKKNQEIEALNTKINNFVYLNAMKYRQLVKDYDKNRSLSHTPIVESPFHRRSTLHIPSDVGGEMYFFRNNNVTNRSPSPTKSTKKLVSQTSFMTLGTEDNVKDENAKDTDFKEGDYFKNYKDLLYKLCIHLFNEKADTLFESKNLNYIESLVVETIYNYKIELTRKLEQVQGDKEEISSVKYKLLTNERVQQSMRQEIEDYRTLITDLKGKIEERDLEIKKQVKVIQFNEDQLRSLNLTINKVKTTNIALKNANESVKNEFKIRDLKEINKSLRANSTFNRGNKAESSISDSFNRATLNINNKYKFKIDTNRKLSSKENISTQQGSKLESLSKEVYSKYETNKTDQLTPREYSIKDIKDTPRDYLEE